MTAIDIIQTVASVLGVVVAAFGFYFVSRQLRKSAHSDIYALGVSIKQALLEHPDLRPYFFDNEHVDAKDSLDQNRILIIADMYCLYLEQIAIYANELGGEKDAWFDFVRAMYSSSPAIRKYLQQHSYAAVLYEAIGAKYTGSSGGV